MWNMVVPTSRAGFPWRCDRRRVNHHAPTAVPRMLARIPYFRLVMSVLPKNMSEQPGYQLKPPKLERRQANSLRRPLGRLPFERIRHERDLRRPVPGPGKKVLLVWNSGALILNCRTGKTSSSRWKSTRSRPEWCRPVQIPYVVVTTPSRSAARVATPSNSRGEPAASQDAVRLLTAVGLTVGIALAPRFAEANDGRTEDRNHSNNGLTPGGG